MPTLDRDRFDHVTELGRVGSHRAPRPRGRGWVTFAWAALATGVLVGAGALGLVGIQSRVANTGDGTVTSAAPSVVPTIDAKVDVVLLNATSTAGLAAKAEKQAKGDGWTVESIANASSTDVKTSTVYYTQSGQAGAAAGLAKSLGLKSTAIALSKQFAVSGQARLTVVLGADYAG